MSSPFKTPEFEVGELYPDQSDVDYEAENFWSSHKAAMKRKLDERAKYRARVLNFGSSWKASKAFEKKMKTKMKWHPAEKARKALELIKAFGIDPGHGYKIQIVMDDVDPPSMPPTPRKLSPLKNLNQVLMKGAKSEAKKRKEEQKKSSVQRSESKAVEAVEEPSPTRDEDLTLTVLASPVPDEKKQLEDRKQPALPSVKYCDGCGSATCLNKNGLSVAVTAANRMSKEEFILQMTGEERIDWFLQLYKTVVGYSVGLKCAAKYADKHLSNDKIESEEDGVESEEDNSSYCSSKYRRYCETEDAYEAEEIKRRLEVREEEEEDVPLAVLAKTLSYPSDWKSIKE